MELIKIKSEKDFISYINRTSVIPFGVNGTTPYELAKKMVNKLSIDWSNPNLKILDPCYGFGSYLFFVYLKLIQFHSVEHILNNMLYGVEIEDFRFELVKHKLKIKNLIKGDFLHNKIFKDMKFDIILANYPYQVKVGPTKTEPIWHLFAKKIPILLKEGGYLSVIHPSSWRSTKGKFTFLKDIYFSKKVISIDLNDFDKGREVFGAGTNFDIVTLINTSYESGFKTKIIDVKDKEHYMDLGDVPFLPNSNFERILSLVVKKDEDTVRGCYSCNEYEHRPERARNPISIEESKEYKYPVVYSITQKNGIKKMWTSEKNYMYVPKVIWSNGLGTYPIVDKKGEYGLTEFAYAILDDVDNLDNIAKALKSKSFLELMKSIKFTNNIYDYKTISTFRKDFWKEFLND